MIERSLLMNNAISHQTFSKFLAELANRVDSSIYISKTCKEKFNPAISALLVDAICLWEQEKWRFLTMADNARLHPESHVFPNSTPAQIRL